MKLNLIRYLSKIHIINQRWTPFNTFLNNYAIIKLIWLLSNVKLVRENLLHLFLLIDKRYLFVYTRPVFFKFYNTYMFIVDLIINYTVNYLTVCFCIAYSKYYFITWNTVNCYNYFLQNTFTLFLWKLFYITIVNTIYYV